MNDATSKPTPPQLPEVWGHPPGLFMLFFAEMWERFCYYGMRALLAFYVASQFATGESGASLTYGAYTSLVYATGIFGGAIADHYLGYRRSIITGGLLMALGEFMIMVPSELMFLLGLAAMVVGNGLFKPNISTLVGKLYPKGDERKDRGFTIFYMGINVGALLGALVCGYIGETWGYRWGFFAAGIGLLLGIVTFHGGRARLLDHGLPPKGKEGILPIVIVVAGSIAASWGIYLLLSKQEWVLNILGSLMGLLVLVLIAEMFRHDRIQAHRLIALLILFAANMMFWAFFEQAGSSFNFFALNLTDRDTMAGEFPASWFQSVNPFFIVVLAPLFVLLWKKLDAARANPSIPAKFGLALVQVGLGFYVLVLGIAITPPEGKTALYFLLLTYFLHTTGELCLSPVGLSMVTKLAPDRMVGLVMGGWFLSVALGNYMAGQIASLVGTGEGGATPESYSAVFSTAGMSCAIAGGAFLLLAPLVNKLMHGVK